MANVGSVTITIYFGTQFNDLNVPYYNKLIRDSATKTLELTGQYVWQNTWLRDIRVNVEDYQDIIGAQYAVISDEGTESHGAHWFVVRGYQQVSQKTAELVIEYDPLLSIQIMNFKTISGTLNRWTPDTANDGHFRWIYTDEPINQADKFVYSYFRHSCVDESKALNPVVGFPYDMTEPPTIALYQNQDGTRTNIYYVKMPYSKEITNFHSTANESIDFNDGMSYYLWRPKEGDLVYESYNKAVGLGQDLTSNAYMLIASPLIVIHLGDNGFIESLTGQVLSQETGLALYDTQYENNKTNDLGIFFELYNEVSGQSVQLANYNLLNTALELSVDPYSSGCFYARFKGYFGDNTGFSGQIASGPFKSYSINSTTQFNVQSAYMQTNNQIQSIETQYSAQRIIADNQLKSDTLSNASALGQGALNAVSGGITAALLMSNPITFIGGATTGISAATGAINSFVNYATNDTNLERMYTANLDASRMVRNQQVAALRTSGTLGKVAPPVFKLNNSVNVSGASYTFVVKRSDLSQNDKQRADIFFRMYGYNVDKLPLNDVSMLNARQRFTFVQADDVEITSTVTVDNMTRLKDPQTVDRIKERFSAGLRIWNINPDYNYTIQNPKK
jgi:hypothetical protein